MANSYSLDLESGSSQYAYANDSATLSLSATGTLEMWVNFESTPSSGNQMVLLSKDNTTTQRSYFWYLKNNSGTLRLEARVNDSSGNSDRYFYNWTPSTATWYHLALTINTNNASATTFEFFINGASVGNGTGVSGETDNISSINDSSSVFGIGSFDGGSTYLDGKVDDIRVWNVVRTEAQILANIRRELVGNESNLNGYWKLNNSALDETSNNNDLTLSGSPTYSTNIPFVESANFLFGLT